MKLPYVIVSIGLSLGTSFLVGCANDIRNNQEQATRTPALSATLTPPTNNPRPQSTPLAKPRGTVPETKTFSIAIKNFNFSPPTIYISRGTTVTWLNYDNTNHTVTGDNGGPKSPSLGPGKNYSYTFKDIGTFPYHCQFHTTMMGNVIVTP